MTLEDLNRKYKGREVAGIQFGGCSEEEAKTVTQVTGLENLGDYLEQRYREEVKASIEGNTEGREPTIVGKLTKEMVCWSFWKDTKEEPMYGCKLLYLTRNGNVNVICPVSEVDWNWKKEYYAITSWMYVDDLICWMSKLSFMNSFWFKSVTREY